MAQPTRRAKHKPRTTNPTNQPSMSVTLPGPAFTAHAVSLHVFDANVHGNFPQIWTRTVFARAFRSDV